MNIKDNLQPDGEIQIKILTQGGQEFKMSFKTTITTKKLKIS